MRVVRPEDDHNLFEFVTQRNLLAQYDLLENLVRVALADSRSRIKHDDIRELNRCAVMQISERPGEYRRTNVTINNAPHKPPDWRKVDELMDEFVCKLDCKWEHSSATHLAAFALWRVNWIHPFLQGNGRTARAVSYMALCLRFQTWLPGINIIPKQIRDNRAPYYEALRAADIAYQRTGMDDISQMERYLGQLLSVQLS